MNSERIEGEQPLWDNQNMPEVSLKESVSFRYEGPALEGRQIDMEDFARALLGYVGLVHAAAKEVAPKAKVPNVYIERAEGGSFETFATIILDPGIREAILAAIRGSGFSDLAQISGFTIKRLVTGLMSFLKDRRGREIKESAQLANGDMKVTFVDNEEVTVSAPVYNIANSKVVIYNVREWTAPLETPGIEALVIPSSSEDENPPVTVGKEIRSYLPDSEGDTERSFVEEQVRIKVLVAPLYAAEGWRFEREDTSSGDLQQLTARVEDEIFLTRVANGEVPIKRGLYLVADIETILPARQGGHRKYVVSNIGDFDLQEEIDFN